jgi:nucleoside-diphosphate-sugar epimerase
MSPVFAYSSTRPVVADVLDRNALLRAVDGLSADVVIHQLTALSKHPARYAGMELTNRLRTTGTTHLLAAARAVGARRFLTQSMVPGYGYTDHGTRVLTERDPFGQQREGKVAPIVAAMASTEQQVLGADGIEGIALRCGAFYGLTNSERFITLLRAGKLPVPSDGGGIMSWIHLADAAAATVAAMDKGVTGQAYNIVDDEPATYGQVFTEHAKAAGTKPPKTPAGLAHPAGRPHVRHPHARHQPAGIERQGQGRTGLDTHTPHLPRGRTRPPRLTSPPKPANRYLENGDGDMDNGLSLRRGPSRLCGQARRNGDVIS